MPSGQTFLQAFNDIFQNYSMSKPIHAIELTNGLQSVQHFFAKFVSANACVYTSIDSEKRSSFLIITMQVKAFASSWFTAYEYNVPVLNSNLETIP